MKRCSKCKKLKSSEDFYAHNISEDGLRSKCVSCLKIIQTQYQETKKGKASQKRYAQSEKGKASRRKHLLSNKGKTTTKISRLAYSKKHPELQRARNAINNAIRAGKIPRADTLKCVCGEQAHEYHHPKGYKPEHWFSIIPICVKCHRRPL